MAYSPARIQLLDQQGVNRASFVDPDYRRRMAIEDIDEALREARNPMPGAKAKKPARHRMSGRLFESARETGV